MSGKQTNSKIDSDIFLTVKPSRVHSSTIRFAHTELILGQSWMKELTWFDLSIWYRNKTKQYHLNKVYTGNHFTSTNNGKNMKNTHFHRYKSIDPRVTNMVHTMLFVIAKVGESLAENWWNPVEESLCKKFGLHKHTGWM